MLSWHIVMRRSWSLSKHSTPPESLAGLLGDAARRRRTPGWGISREMIWCLNFFLRHTIIVSTPNVVPVTELRMKIQRPYGESDYRTLRAGLPPPESVSRSRSGVGVGVGGVAKRRSSRSSSSSSSDSDSSLCRSSINSIYDNIHRKG